MRSMLENPMTHEQTGEARKARRSERVNAAYRELQREFITGVFANPLHVISTPAFVPDRMRLVDVVADLTACGDGLHLLESMLHLVTQVAEHDESPQRLTAQALLARMAHHHAEAHAEDRVTFDEGLLDG
jgi:hypothetical protein